MDAGNAVKHCACPINKKDVAANRGSGLCAYSSDLAKLHGDKIWAGFSIRIASLPASMEGECPTTECYALCIQGPSSITAKTVS